MASAYLSRTSGTSTNTDKCTLSVWIKRSKLSGNDEIIIGEYTDASNRAKLLFNADQLHYFQKTGGSTTADVKTTRVFRDSSAWYHIVIAFDTTQSTNTDRIKFYINGVQETAFDNTSYPSSGQNIRINESSITQLIGYAGTTNTYFDGSMAHVHFTDGYVYAASDFGETDATTGIWKPKTSPTGISYGTNGFFLKFDNSANMGLDSSGQSNNLTTNGTIIQNKDTPSNVFATINPLDDYYFGGTFSNVNNTVTGSSSSYTYCTSTLGVSKGKYYVEARPSTATTNGIGDRQDEVAFQTNGNLKLNSATTTSWGSTWTTNDIIGIALDLDNNKIYFSKNGTFVASGNPSTGANGQTITAASSTIDGFYRFGFGDNNSTGSSTFQFNFGNGFFGTTAVASAQTPDDGVGVFEYDPPTGYRALCTKSINAQEYS